MCENCGFGRPAEAETLVAAPTHSHKRAPWKILVAIGIVFILMGAGAGAYFFIQGDAPTALAAIAPMSRAARDTLVTERILEYGAGFGMASSINATRHVLDIADAGGASHYEWRQELGLTNVTARTFTVDEPNQKIAASAFCAGSGSLEQYLEGTDVAKGFVAGNYVRIRDGEYRCGDNQRDLPWAYWLQFDTRADFWHLTKANMSNLTSRQSPTGEVVGEFDHSGIHYTVSLDASSRLAAIRGTYDSSVETMEFTYGTRAPIALPTGDFPDALLDLQCTVQHEELGGNNYVFMISSRVPLRAGEVTLVIRNTTTGEDIETAYPDELNLQSSGQHLEMALTNIQRLTFDSNGDRAFGGGDVLRIDGLEPGFTAGLADHRVEEYRTCESPLPAAA